MLTNRHFIVTTVVVTSLIMFTGLIVFFSTSLFVVHFGVSHPGLLILVASIAVSVIIHLILEYYFFYMRAGIKFSDYYGKIKFPVVQGVALFLAWILLIFIPFYFGDDVFSMVALILGKGASNKYAAVTWTISNAIFLRNFLLAYALVSDRTPVDSPAP